MRARAAPRAQREVKRCLRKSSPFTSFSPTFGKLTIEFELLCKKTISQQFQSFGEETSGFGRGEGVGRDGEGAAGEPCGG